MANQTPKERESPSKAEFDAAIDNLMAAGRRGMNFMTLLHEAHSKAELQRLLEEASRMQREGCSIDFAQEVNPGLSEMGLECILNPESAEYEIRDLATQKRQF